jgi:plasmid stabilization system protein ParE
VARLRFSASAKADLESIATYIAEQSGSRATAQRFTGELRRKCADLAAAPIRMGRPRTELHPDLRSHPYKSYVILFRYVGTVLEIVNLIEGHRDIPALFGQDEPPASEE